MEKEGWGVFDRHTKFNREELPVLKYEQRKYSRQSGACKGKHRDRQISS